MRELPEVITSLLVNHSANLFFVIRTLAYDAGKVRLGFVLRSEFAKASHITSALGCALDCVARVAGHQVLGHCAATESEVNFHPEALRLDVLQEFIAEARLDHVDNNLALFTSSIYTLGDRNHRLLVNASGTLKRLQTNNLVAIADWRQRRAACAR